MKVKTYSTFVKIEVTEQPLVDYQFLTRFTIVKWLRRKTNGFDRLFFMSNWRVKP